MSVGERALQDPALGSVWRQLAGTMQTSAVDRAGGEKYGQDIGWITDCEGALNVL